MNPDPSRANSQKSRQGPIEWMARNPIAANLLMFILIVGGIWTAFTIQKEVFPDFELDLVEVYVSYPGANPAEVEHGILLPVEDSVQGVEGIEEITSTAREESGRVQIELVSGADRMKVFQDIDQAVNRIRTFPDDIEEPEVRLVDRRRHVMEIGLFGDVDIWTLRGIAEQLRDRLLAHEAITQVELGNVPDYVTHVEISRNTLRKYGLTLSQVAEIIGASSRDIPAGALETAGGEILLRMKERRQWAREFGDIDIVTSARGSGVSLSEIAEITDDFEDTGFHSQFNRQPSVEVEIFRVGTQDPLEVAAAVQEVLAGFKQDLPPGVKTRIDSNIAEDYGQRLWLLLKNGVIGLFIVLGILTVFLEYRLAFWVMMGMAISFVGGLVFLPFAGVSINMISMFAFLVALGIVVDDAIVVGENVYEHRQQGEGFISAAVAGAREMVGPVTFSILTNVVAFVPLLFVPGTMGKFWWTLPAVVIVVLFVSLFEAVFILPAHLAHSSAGASTRPGRRLQILQQGFALRFSRFVDRYYRAFLDFCLRYRYVTLVAAFALLLVVGGYAYSGHMGMIMMPEVSADEIEAGVTLPVDTTPAQAAQVADQITESTLRMFEKHDLQRVAEGVKTNVRGQDFIIRSADGVEVPFTDIAELNKGVAFTSINRRDGRRVVTVSMAVEPKSAITRVMKEIREDLLPSLRADYPGITWAFQGGEAEMRESTSVLLGFDLSLISLMGIIALSGVVVNDSLIMIHYANKKRVLNSAFDSIHQAGLRRFRPIMLTTLTTFGGLTPIILETSRQAAYLIPMAISLGFGIVFATSIILVIVPCLYLAIDDIAVLCG